MSKSLPPKAEMPVVILCGGQGTRLREETEHRPKPMVEIGGKPILWHIMKLYGHHGFERFVLCLGYKGWVIKQYFLALPRDAAATSPSPWTSGARSLPQPIAASERWRVTCAETGEDSATGARL